MCNAAVTDLPTSPTILYMLLNCRKYYGKIGRFAAEEVMSQLGTSKCMTMFGLEACPLNKTNLKSLDFSTFNEIIQNK